MSDSQPGPSGLQKFSSPKKKRARCSLSSSEKTVICNIYKTIEEMWPKDSFIYSKDVAKKTAETAGVHLSTVYRIIKEYRTHKRVSSPTPAPKKGTIMDKLDDMTLSGIRRKVHMLFFDNDPPTIEKVLNLVNEDDSLPSFKRTTFQKVLNKLKIKYLKRSRRSVLIEKEEIVRWRFYYLQKMLRMREQRRKIYYLDETWVNEGHTKSKIWQDLSIESARQAYQEGLSTGLKAPSGKGKRLIVVHIGNEDGFVENADLIFESKKGEGDYHREMNSKVFEEWFSRTLEKLEPNSIIVMDNAPYHSRRLERVPSMNWLKKDIQSWLTEKGISFQAEMIKALDLVTPEREKYSAFVCDTMAKQHNIEVLRLPPYHCELNPIELIWGQVKGHVAEKNKTFKIIDLKKILSEAIKSITSAAWQQCVNHVIKEEKKMAELDGISDNVIDNFIIRVTDSSTSPSSSASDEEDE
ncbi:uncharacterized protein [Epargyreus clarus]|uniref:uncharacterized protein n=1 Tax=Epargyreus clarus TaxID=520877 RepID=UPI003C2D84BC